MQHKLNCKSGRAKMYRRWKLTERCPEWNGSVHAELWVCMLIWRTARIQIQKELWNGWNIFLFKLTKLSPPKTFASPLTTSEPQKEWFLYWTVVCVFSGLEWEGTTLIVLKHSALMTTNKTIGVVCKHKLSFNDKLNFLKYCRLSENYG